MFIISTQQASHIAKKLSSFAGFEIIWPGLNRDQKRYFPDKELYVKIRDYRKLRGKRTIVLHSGAPKPNDGLVELELILQVLKEAEAKPIEVFFTYFPYSMQDKVFEKGETNVAENLAEKLVSYYKVKRIFVIDPHFGGRAWMKKYPILAVSALPVLMAAARKDFGENLVFASPDQGGKRRTGIKIIKGLKKKRYGYSNALFGNWVDAKASLERKTIAVVDDILETGGTLVNFQKVCSKAGAKNCIALVTHGVLDRGIKLVKKSYDKLYLTNTINQKAANIDITSLIVKRLLLP